MHDVCTGRSENLMSANLGRESINSEERIPDSSQIPRKF